MSWQDSLRPASWRDLPFGVWSLEGRFGRDLAVHEFPLRDSVKIEDMGRAGRRYRLIGFLVGDDVIAREKAMIEAAEEEGPGTLVHPTLGALTVSCNELVPVWRHDLGGVVELTWYFLEEGTSGGLQQVENLGATVGRWADDLDLGSLADFSRSAGASLAQGLRMVQGARDTIRGWTGTASRLLGDARSILGAAGGVAPGLDRTLGRFASGIRNPLATVDRAFTTLGGALSRVSSARQAATQGVARISALLDRL